ncbi:helix-turn-helix domain-containing protein [Arthrobacter sp.]|uniref:AraC family transcriptional regulator n=1 Tax=Arthrobacter sp. TaxID=1667 RepID=UPI0033963C66
MHTMRTGKTLRDRHPIPPVHGAKALGSAVRAHVPTEARRRPAGSRMAIDFSPFVCTANRPTATPHVRSTIWPALVLPATKCSSDVMEDTQSAVRPVSPLTSSHRVSVESTLVDEAREVGGRVYHPHHLTMLGRAADFQMRLKAADLGKVTVGMLDYSSPVRIRTGPLADAYQVNTALYGQVKHCYGEQIVVATPRLAAVHGMGQETWFEGWDRPARMLGLKIPHDVVNQELAALLDRVPERPLVFTGTLDLTSTAGSEWRQAMQLLMSGLRGRGSILGNPLIALPAVQAVVRGLLLAAPNNYTAELIGDVSAVDSSSVRRAVEYIEANAAKPLTLEDIAAFACVSPRSLQAGFRKHLNSTPMELLRTVRMRNVRNELLTAPPEARIGDIAAGWGFAHAGRFAIRYAQTFGESPSETLRKSTT